MFLLLFFLFVGVRPHAPDAEGEDAGLGRVDRDSTSLGDEVSFVEESSVDQVLVDEVSGVRVSVSLETDLVEKLPSGYGDRIIDLHRQESLFQFRFPFVVSRLKARTTHESTQGVGEEKGEIKFDRLDSDLICGIVFRVGVVFRIAPRFEQATRACDEEFRKDKSSDRKSVAGNGALFPNMIDEVFFVGLSLGC